MKPQRPPRFETRRAKEIESELIKRAKAWMPAWGMDDDQRDFGRALLKIAARFGSEVAERLDRGGEKNRLGFLDWLAVRGEATRPARLPVVFKLTDRARGPKRAAASTRLLVEAGGASVVLETETEMLVLPRGLQALVGVDGARDAFFLAPPGLASLAPLAPVPTQWLLKRFASAGATRLQLDPEQGLAPQMIVELGAKEYRLTQVNKGIVTLDPPLAADHAAQSPVTKVSAFMPFDAAAHNRQAHALYLGHNELFDIEAAALIELAGAKDLVSVAWHYWGKLAPGSETAWYPLPLAEASLQARSDGLVFAKPKGAMEMLELVPGSESRWIRASLNTVGAAQAPLLVDGFDIGINCLRGAAPALHPECVPGSAAAEGMANTTPLQLGQIFFPLGREPRQFDAFYLGSQEAFSKKHAQVKLVFELADENFTSLTGLRRGPRANQALAGVAADGQLHLLEFAPATGALTPLLGRTALRPSAPVAQRTPEPRDNLPVGLDPHPAYRVPIWSSGTDIFVAVAGRGAVWLWHENELDQNLSGWRALDAAGPVDDPGEPIEGLVYLADGASGQLVALRAAALFVRDLTPGAGNWQPLAASVAGQPVKWAKIAPICSEDDDLGNGSAAAGLVGISTKNELFGVTLAGQCHKLLDGIETAVAPVAVRRADNRLVAAAVDTSSPRHLRAFRSTPVPNSFNNEIEDDAELDARPVQGALLDMNLHAGDLTVVVARGVAPGSTGLASWRPFAPAGQGELFEVPLPVPREALAGAPTLLSGHVLVPTSSGQVLVAPFDRTNRLELSVALRTAVIAAKRFADGDQLALPVAIGAAGITYALRAIPAAGVEFRARVLYEFDLHAIDQPLLEYRAAAPALPAKVDPAARDTIKIRAADPVLAEGAVLLIKTSMSSQLYAVVHFNTATRVARLDRPLDVGQSASAKVTYVAPQTSAALIRPMLRLDPADTEQWPQHLPDPVRLFFYGATPAFMPATAYRPELLVLAEHWRTQPTVTAGKVKLIVDGAVGEWTTRLGDGPGNPELSWEYWNGKGWWALEIDFDGTLALKRSGGVKFQVPTDIASSDWAGRINYWIRARLIGGDYGRETVTVETEPINKAVSRQTVIRSTDGIRAPAVAGLDISYCVCEREGPTFVLTCDSGSIRDQSDANRTPGALVEAFVPLALLLGRLSAPLVAGPAAPDGADTAIAPGPAAGRALYLGFDAPLLGEPVNLLLLVEERRHDKFAPMCVEALVAGRFVPVVVNDATRALGESGVLSLALPVVPTPRELFGQTLNWLRLTPAAGAPPDEWKPKLLGAYLNGVWASAAETLTRELVGSSRGEPNLTLYLARPPLVRNTLELRVKEPLGDEELAQLQAEGAGQVLTTLEQLPGSWVLWRQVTDPGDAAPGARVYALDEASGEIRFGDGHHGRIPPIGRDSIMAFSYRRTAPGAPGGVDLPGNAIGARTPLNLVSPIDGVEAVFAADQSAGGAPPQDADTVLRLGPARLRHRGRALTARDIEDMVYEHAPDVAQARCFPSQGYVQLVAVMRGANPIPGAAQLRALRRMLVAAGPPAFGEHDALRLDGPALRRLRVDLRLRVASLDDAGAVARDARRRIMALFDSATGGVDGEGWPLGENPSQADVAVGLADLARLEGIVAIALSEIASDGAERPWPDALRRTELPWLGEDGVRIAFDSGGVAT
nr:hypothetical protein [uncultured Duganella sp.]